MQPVAGLRIVQPSCAHGHANIVTFVPITLSEVEGSCKHHIANRMYALLAGEVCLARTMRRQPARRVCPKHVIHFLDMIVFELKPRNVCRGATG